MDDSSQPRFRPRRWEHLESPVDVELWIEEHNLSLREHIRPGETGYGVRFSLREGGQIVMQTSEDGAVLLDVDADAAWVAPLISAATRAQPPAGSLWILPDDVLVQLVLGLNSLIESTTLVVGYTMAGRQRMGRQG